MRTLLTITLLLFMTAMAHAQTIELQGRAKVTQMDKVNTADSVVVRLPDGILGVRDVSTLVEHQVLSTSNDTIFLSDGGFVKLPDGSDSNEIQSFSVSILADTLFVSDGNSVIIPGITAANYTVQERLDAGATPCELFADGVPFSDLYGKSYAGGLIFYLGSGACTGMVAALTDQSSGAEWGCGGSGGGGTFIGGASPTSIGSGAPNTVAILANCAQSDIAASHADTYDDGTYSDWFLPSRQELQEMYFKLKVNGLGGFSSVDYWSSSQVSNNTAWAVRFGNNGANDEDWKSDLHFVRAARSFSD